MKFRAYFIVALLATGSTVSDAGVCRGSGCRQSSLRISRANRLFPEDFKNIDGANRLRAANGDLFETDRFGRVQAKLFIIQRGRYRGRLARRAIDRFGRPIGRFFLVSQNHETLRQIRTFFFKNKQKFIDAKEDDFRRGDRRTGTVNLEKQRLIELFQDVNTPGASTQLVVDIEDTPAASALKAKGHSDDEIKTKTANHLFNLFGLNNSNIVRPVPRGDGTLNVNLSGQMDPNDVAMLKLSNPYACSEGERLSKPPGLGWLSTFMTAQATYNALNKMPTDKTTFARQFGIQEANQGVPPAETRVVVPGRRNGVNAPGGSPVVTGPNRSLGLQRQNNGRAIQISYDEPNNDRSGDATESRDPLTNSLNPDHKAEEILGASAKPGIFFGALFQADGVLQNEAPANVAGQYNNPHGGFAVANMISCLYCHTNGFNGTPNARAKPGEQLEEIRPWELPGVRDRGRIEQAYDSWGQRDGFNTGFNAGFTQGLKNMDAYIFTQYPEEIAGQTEGAAPLIPWQVEEFQKNLSFAQMAKELLHRFPNDGSEATPQDVESLKNFILNSDLGALFRQGERVGFLQNASTSVDPAQLQAKDFVINRSVFEARFCEIRTGWKGVHPRFANEINPQGARRIDQRGRIQRSIH